MMTSAAKPGRRWLVFGVAMGGVVACLLLPPLRQAESYHQFADQRTWCGIPNFLNVLSNVGFIVVGGAGLVSLLRKGGRAVTFFDRRERWPYGVFFLGVILTGFGSIYYHRTPNGSTLAWDRLPMTVAFMAVLAATISERISVRAGLILLGPLVLVGAASAEYWRWTGNLWPYAAVQYFSPLLIGLMMMLFPPRYTRSIDLLWVAAIYGVAKLAEVLDGPIFAAGHWLSGHTLKHLIAAFAVFWVWRMLRRRTIREDGDSGVVPSHAQAPWGRRCDHDPAIQDP